VELARRLPGLLEFASSLGGITQRDLGIREIACLYSRETLNSVSYLRLLAAEIRHVMYRRRRRRRRRLF